MSQVLRRFCSTKHKNKLLNSCLFNQSRTSGFHSVTSRKNHGWKVALAFGAGCTVTGWSIASFMWWKEKRNTNVQTSPVSNSFKLQPLNQENQPSLCESNSELLTPGSGDLLSTSPWFESRDPAIAKSELNKKINEKISVAKRKVNDICWRIKDESGSPGLSLAVSVDGKIIHEAGFGYSDVENRLLCQPDTVMRIASISKCVTMAAVAKLWEDGKLDLDKPVQHYVPQWPSKSVDEEPVTITTRHLVSHLGGIRHYDKTCTKHRNRQDQTMVLEDSTKSNDETKQKERQSEAGQRASELEQQEYHIKKKFPSVTASLNLFKNDKLCSKPGTEFLYTTHGWTLITAVIEGASGKKFPLVAKEIFNELGLQNTYLDENDPLIYKRARFYKRNGVGRLINVPYVDCSYKWGGGGMLSNVRDLTRFGNAMLYSYQSHLWNGRTKASLNNNNNDEKSASSTNSLSGLVNVNNDIITVATEDVVANDNATVTKDNNSNDRSPNPNDSSTLPKNQSPDKDSKSLQRYVKPKRVFLKPETVRMMWTPVKGTQISWDRDAVDGGYGMGWGVVPERAKPGAVDDQKFYVSHTGGAIGASSVLLIMPTDTDHLMKENKKDATLTLERPFIVHTQEPHPRGVVVAMIANMQAVGLNKSAREIAKIFYDVDADIRELEANQKNKHSSKVKGNLESCST